MNEHIPEWGEETRFPSEAAVNAIADSQTENAMNLISVDRRQGVTAEKIYKLRRKRDALFNTGLFSDPAWDILLDLYVSEKAGKKICITNACIAAGMPASTGLRWISILDQNGYVERQDDPADAGRSLVHLTNTARNALQSLFEEPA